MHCVFKVRIRTSPRWKKIQ